LSSSQTEPRTQNSTLALRVATLEEKVRRAGAEDERDMVTEKLQQAEKEKATLARELERVWCVCVMYAYRHIDIYSYIHMCLCTV
jgi:hypothetical protein